jgi:hypothetical protein
LFGLATLSRVKDGIGEAVTNVGNIVRTIARYICILVILNISLTVRYRQNNVMPCITISHLYINIYRMFLRHQVFPVVLQWRITALNRDNKT